MVYIEHDEPLSGVKRSHCCKIPPVDKKKLKAILARRKRHIPEEFVRDARGTQKEEGEKLSRVQRRLHAKRQEAEIKRNNLVNQWLKLKANEEEFRSVFIQFHQFVIDNREKIERETAKIHQFRQNVIDKEKKICEVKEKTAHFQKIFEQMKQQFSTHGLYEKFLEEYTEYTESKSTQDVLFRYELLLEAREGVEETMRRKHDSILQYAKNYNDVLQKWTGEITKFGETLTQQSKKFEDAQRQVVYWEKTIFDIKKNAHSIWLDMELTRDSLDHVICLLLIRMKAKVEPLFFRESKKFQHLLSTREGKIIYLNKMLGDLMHVKEEVREFLKKEERAVKIDAATAMPSQQEPRQRKRPKLRAEKQSLYQMFPVLSEGTTRIIELLEYRMKREKMLGRRRAIKNWGTLRSWGTHQMSDTSSTFASICSLESRDRAMTSWEITKEARRFRKSTLPSLAIIPDPILTKRETVMSTGSNRSSIPLSKKLEYFRDRYSCVNLTTDATTHLLDEKRNVAQDRIIERNFDRYEKFLCNKMDTDSSLIKINKETGKLKLPKLRIKRKHPIEKPSLAVTLPKLEPVLQKKYRKRWLDDTSIRTAQSHTSSVKSTTKSKKALSEEIEKFLSRATIAQHYTFGNLF